MYKLTMSPCLIDRWAHPSNFKEGLQMLHCKIAHTYGLAPGHEWQDQHIHSLSRVLFHIKSARGNDLSPSQSAWPSAHHSSSFSKSFRGMQKHLIKTLCIFRTLPVMSHAKTPCWEESCIVKPSCKVEIFHHSPRLMSENSVLLGIWWYPASMPISLV